MLWVRLFWLLFCICYSPAWCVSATRRGSSMAFKQPPSPFSSQSLPSTPGWEAAGSSVCLVIVTTISCFAHHGTSTRT